MIDLQCYRLQALPALWHGSECGAWACVPRSTVMPVSIRFSLLLVLCLATACGAVAQEASGGQRGDWVLVWQEAFDARDAAFNARWDIGTHTFDGNGSALDRALRGAGGDGVGRGDGAAVGGAVAPEASGARGVRLDRACVSSRDDAVSHDPEGLWRQDKGVMPVASPDHFH